MRRGDIGVRAQTVTPVLAAGLNLARDHGVVLADVLPAGPAARAGLRPGDLVLTLDGKPMENGRQLQVSLYRRLVGDVVTLEILRDGQAMKVPVAMTERRDPFAGLSEAIDPRQNLVPRLGILGVNLDRANRARCCLCVRVRSGVVVASTSLARSIPGTGDWLPATSSTRSTAHRSPGSQSCGPLLDGLKTGDPVVLQLERRGELMYLAFTVE